MSTMHPNEAQAVKQGDIAPDFSLLGIDGKLYTLSAVTAVQPVIVLFYRGDW